MSSTATAASHSSVDRFGADWHGKTVLVVGLGRSGQAASRLLLRLGARVRATDSQTTDALQVTALELQTAGVDRIELGKHSRAMLDGLEAVVVSPGVPESSPALVWAREARVPILSEIELAFRFCPCPIVGVTGTNGKSSVVTMIAQVAQAAWPARLQAGRRAIACGNVGIPFSSVLPQLASDSLAVVEVSSFQLLGCHTFRPAIAVLLNIGTNHLDRHAHHDDYVAAKAKLFACQTPEDHAVLNAGDAEVVRISGGMRASQVWFGASGSEDGSEFALHPATCRALPPSQQAVLQVARLLGIPDPLSYQVLRSFRGLEHRLEYVGSIRGVTCVNDSKSTTPDSLLYALTRIAGPVVPIIGGKNKGMDFSSLKTALGDARIRGVVLIGETRPQLRALLMDTATLRESDTLEQAVEAALALGQPGDTLLLSPACASFDMFRDFEERGRAFKALIRMLVDSEDRA